VVQSLEGYVISPYIQERVISMPPALAASIMVQMLYMRDVLGEQVK
jgi:predicted PurR-regulated permease PerM